MLSLYPREHKKKQNEANSIFIGSRLLLGGCAEEKKTDVRWATFNVRYDNPQDSLNNWQYRKDRVCQFIKDRELDIVGMQEVLHNQFQDLRAGLPEYDGIGVDVMTGRQQVNMRRYSIVRTNMRCWTPILSGWPKIPIA